MFDSTFTDILDAKTSTIYTADVLWKNLEADITIFADDSIYVGKFTQESAQNFYTLLELEPEEYFKNLKDAFSSRTDKFDFDPTAGVLTCSKSYENMFVILARIELQKLSATQIVMQVVKPLLSARRRLSDEFERLKANEASLKEDLESITRKFEESVRLKGEMEEILMKKFTLVLNEKKNYINFLKGNTEEPQSSSNPTSRKRLTISSSDDDDMDI